MIKRCLIKTVNSFMYAIGINTVVYAIILIVTGWVPLLPDYASRFSSDTEALLIQIILIGFMSAALGGGSVIMELERIGLFAQSVIYFAISLCVWLWVGNFCWCISKYPQALVSVVVSYTVSYIICWAIQYRLCKRNIEEINKRIEELRGEKYGERNSY